MILIADTETTGLSKLDEIVEFAYILVDEKLNILDKAEYLVRPSILISESASSTNGITNDMVKDCPSFREVTEGLQKEKGIVFQDITLVAHNGHFDERMFSPCWGISRVIDTCRAAQQLYPDAPNHKLTTLRDHFSLRQDQRAHSAMGDVYVLYDLFKMQLEDTGMSIDEFYNELKKPVKFEVMPFGKYKGKPVGEVPKQYVRWVLENFDDRYGDLRLTFGRS